jgi:hypothetical protein
MRETKLFPVNGAAFVLAALLGSVGFASAADEADQKVEEHGDVMTAQVGTLPPQELAPGQCGFFLWTNSSDPRLVFVSLASGNARMVVNGENLDLSRNSAEGQEYLGQFENQNFQNPELNVALNIVVERRPNIVDGAVIPSATLRLTESNGWETVLPVGGLIGCGEA